ncbi:uncharacterized protein LOC131301381 isoform X1 [Rhododendron vialii]|uniref:uncharacterized protein LOC131301381 isoform X1 n=2 Tax=Rhododendron vialii TaxID=182163 RepID=UPI00265E92FF|nr:uncharacterized protein LOC131301381 isoform X1 [Rhododendron vialii]
MQNGMETNCDCRTATGDTIGYISKHLAPLSLDDQFVQKDDMKEDTMLTALDDPFKNITVYPPGVDVPPHVFDFVEEIRRPSPREMLFHHAFLQKMKKEREDRIMTTMGRGYRTCTDGRPLGFSQPCMVLMNVLPVNPMPPRLAPETE